MKRRSFETLVGFLVLLTALGFLFYSLNRASVTYREHYNIIAKFKDVDGIFVGSDVKIGGVKIGSITKQDIDQNTYRAVVTMSIRKDIKLPKDTSVKVASSGIIGGRYLMIQAGNSDKYIKEGGEIRFTQSALNFEELIGKFAFKGDKKNKK